MVMPNMLMWSIHSLPVLTLLVLLGERDTSINKCPPQEQFLISFLFYFSNYYNYTTLEYYNQPRRQDPKAKGSQ